MLYKKIDLHCTVFCNVSEEVAKEYIDHRINKKKPLTQGAFNRAMNQAVLCMQKGITKSADEAIEFVCSQGWDGVTPEYIAAEKAKRFDASVKAFAQNYAQNNQARVGTARSTRDISIAEQLTDKSWAN